MNNYILKILFLSGLMLVFFATGFAQNGRFSSQWATANQAYEQKNYEQAAVLYQEIIDGGHISPAVFYNLGNAYFRLNEYPKALFYYAKTVHLQPKNKQAQDNLLVAQSKIQNPITALKPVFFVVWWNGVISFLGINFLAVIAIFFFVGILIVLFLHFSGKRSIPYLGRWIAAMGVIWIFSLLLYFSALQKQNTLHAVVMKADQPFYESVEQNPSQINVPAGTLLIVESKSKDQLIVRLPNGAKGWMNPESLKIVEE